jgi:ligand-binding SRPBCC domain-containing protein
VTRGAGLAVSPVVRVHVLEREQLIPRGIEEVWAFFGDAHNLEAITPPFLGFEVATPRPIDMHPGALIEYRLRLHGVPIRWRTVIEDWDAPHRFVDRQISGPYALWHHTHTFTDLDGGAATLMRDRVRYRIPLGILGGLAGLALVHRDVRAIFDFRAQEIERRLSG